eukprot:TRINITY_DN4938_c0_g1_i2.p1 TRINITY_DN4938_c0_g1~~TRINITY_DN4938_c0_g1_i2.p1  ORF type:complete len:252 (-),score=36.74 TRINITY_DN4938_c0_g1_i2:128-883(-)
MTTKVTSFDTGHHEMIHDAQWDYYAKRVATASSDGVVKVFESDEQTLITEIKGHEGPIWQCAWSHPKFGSLIATCSFDRTVCIWSLADSKPQQVFKHDKHTASVNAISWAPAENGLILACGSSDGNVSFISRNDANEWTVDMFPAHKQGVTGVSFSPAVPDDKSYLPPRLVSCGCDSNVFVWDKTESGWVHGDALNGHSGWVRDVAFAPTVGLPGAMFASAGQDKMVVIWSQDERNGEWENTQLPEIGRHV